ncbi:MFS transporter [Subtercola sp. Z020]|uniref:MFS transporter n=1 Tax=Subtercola sp. Z020 TaxID=2080582 RepID=UPI001E42982E|nr:MFS transporter [Subtercola sp. Z020]
MNALASARALRPFRVPQYRLLVVALTFSLFGSGMWLVAVVWQVIALGGGPTDLSLVAAGSSVGLVAAVLVGGVAADRVPQRAILIATETVKTATVAVIGALALTATLELWHLVVAATLLGVVDGFFYPAYSALLPSVLPPDDLLAANGIEGMLRPALMSAAGPAVASAAIAVLSPGLAFLAVAASQAIDVLVLLAMRRAAAGTDGGALRANGGAVRADANTAGASADVVVVRGAGAGADVGAVGADADVDVARAGAGAGVGAVGTDADSGAGGSGGSGGSRRKRAGEGGAAGAEHPFRGAVRDLAEGFRYMVRTPWLLATLLFATLLVLMVMGPIEVLLPFAVRDQTGGGPGAFALVLTAYGVGGILGSLTVASLRLPRRYLTIMMLLWGAGVIPLAVVGYASDLWIMIVALFVVGFTFAAATVIWGTLLQRRVPSHMLGRVSSLDFFVSLLFMPISMAFAGPVGEAVGLQPAFLVAGLGPVVITVVAIVVARMPRDEIAHPLDAYAGGQPLGQEVAPVDQRR